VILGLRKETDGSPSPLPDINEMGKQNLGSAVYILFMYCLIDVLAFTFGFHQILSPPACVRNQDFLNNISETNYLQVYILQNILLMTSCLFLHFRSKSAYSTTGWQLYNHYLLPQILRHPQLNQVLLHCLHNGMLHHQQKMSLHWSTCFIQETRTSISKVYFKTWR